MVTELYWVEGPWPGRLAVMPRPRGDDWLEGELRSWRRSGVDVVVSLLPPDEIAELGLEAEEEFCRALGTDFLSYPVTDRGIPPSWEATAEVATKLAAYLADGKNVAIHCRMGVGRAPLLALCLLVLSGVDAQMAIQRVSAARGRPVPETAEQLRWLTEFALAAAARHPK
jgi:protein-tyrosine phosphatase